jgi:hypothetical protein
LREANGNVNATAASGATVPHAGQDDLLVQCGYCVAFSFFFAS